MKIRFNHLVIAGYIIGTMSTHMVSAAEPTTALYHACEAKQTTAEQRICYPLVFAQSEAELVETEKNTRANLLALAKESQGSRLMYPVKAFDKAERTYRAFRSAESNRILTSYGSGNGGDLAAYQTMIEMNLARIKQLKGE